MKDFIIKKAQKEDSDFIAEGILAAVGDEVCAGLAASIQRGKGSLRQMFSKIASMDNSQYSYHNTLIAYDKDGNRAGVIIAYDGAKLHDLRQAFVDTFNEMSGLNLSESEYDDETSPDEIYIDTVMVRPEYRKKGLGTALIYEIKQKYSKCGKPLGLLVDHDNLKAKKLYENLGFKAVGERRFAGTDMLHMQKPE